MLTLKNESLAIEMLDPAADADRLGTRFCRGGSIWQVRDTSGQALFAGPEWPNPSPDPFNSQGAPEVIRHSELGTGRPLTHRDGRGIVPGCGTAFWDEGDPVIEEPAAWHVSREDGAVHFCTQQSGYDFAFDISRSVILEGTRIRSQTSITNRSRFPVPVHWFAHPFFPLADGVLTARFRGKVAMERNDGFTFERGRLAFRRRFTGTDDGHFQPMQPDPDAPFSCVVEHPRTGFVTMETQAPADRLYVWANGNTFSVEPYLLRVLEPEEVVHTQVSYVFGDPDAS